MSNSFQFKQFSIVQDKCAMKVGTDSVLLASWCKIRKGKVLDIGSGTGVMSLMLAQRDKSIYVDAIDINKAAYLQTKENIAHSPWSSRVKAYHSSLQHFNTDKTFQVIITNPPYFSNAFKSPEQDRNEARHNDALSWEDLLVGVKKHLSTEGLFVVVLPSQAHESFIALAQKKGLFLARKCLVFPNPLKKAKRVLMEFKQQETSVVYEELTIEKEERHHYTEEYVNLTKDFYLHF